MASARAECYHCVYCSWEPMTAEEYRAHDSDEHRDERRAETWRQLEAGELNPLIRALIATAVDDDDRPG